LRPGRKCFLYSLIFDYELRAPPLFFQLFSFSGAVCWVWARGHARRMDALEATPVAFASPLPIEPAIYI
jgi:hypothetical protein